MEIGTTKGLNSLSLSKGFATPHYFIVSADQVISTSMKSAISKIPRLFLCKDTVVNVCDSL